MTLRRDEPRLGHAPVRLLLKPHVIDPGQRRRTKRIGVRRTVPIRVREASDSIASRIINVSATGVQLVVPEALPIGAELQLDVLPGNRCAATVRWSTHSPSGSLVGAEWHMPMSYEQVWKIRAFTSA